MIFYIFVWEIYRFVNFINRWTSLKHSSCIQFILLFQANQISMSMSRNGKVAVKTSSVNVCVWPEAIFLIRGIWLRILRRCVSIQSCVETGESLKKRQPMFSKISAVGPFVSSRLAGFPALIYLFVFYKTPLFV